MRQNKEFKRTLSVLI